MKLTTVLVLILGILSETPLFFAQFTSYSPTVNVYRGDHRLQGHVQTFGKGRSAIRFGVDDHHHDNQPAVGVGITTNSNHNFDRTRSPNPPFHQLVNYKLNFSPVQTFSSSAEFIPNSQRETRRSGAQSGSPVFSGNGQHQTHQSQRQGATPGGSVRFPGENTNTNANTNGNIQFSSGHQQGQQPGISFDQQVNNNDRVSPPPQQSSPSASCVSSDGQPGLCQSFSLCALYMPEFLLVSKTTPNVRSKGNTCRLFDGTSGSCCKAIKLNPAETPNSPASSIREKEATIISRLGGNFLGQVNERSVEDSLKKGRVFFDDYDRMEQGLLSRNLAVKRGTSSHGHLQFFRTSRRAIALSRLGLNLVQSTRELGMNASANTSGRSFSGANGNPADVGVTLKRLNVGKSSIARDCPSRIQCDSNSNLNNNYRTVDGSCNNLRNPRFGTALSPLTRLLIPQYSDGVWSPRVAADQSPLPSTRLLSSVFNQDIDSPNSDYSLWVMQLGQFIDHDLSHVPVYRFSNGSGIECCTPEGDFLPATLTHPNCLAIEIPHNDGFYRPFRQHCMNFVRSMIGPRPDCSLGYADQLNQITSYLDSSNVYGSTQEDHQELREFRGGRLKTERLQSMLFSTGNGRPNFDERAFQGQGQGQSSKLKGMLPIQTADLGDDECTNDVNTNAFCFNAGDLRVNEMIGLTVTHLLWFREHNRIAGSLQRMNPHWDDGRLFGEARKILNAQYQHIIYNEWLPIIIGRTYMEVYGILPQSEGYFQGYDETIDVGVSNAFSAAAFRMGHTLIQGLLPLINQAGQVEDELVIHEHFNKPFRLREIRMVDKLLRTLSNYPIQGFDRFITSEVTTRLFQEENKPFGMDLIALNIQRGRDHGIPGYNAYRELCGLPKVTRFDEFRDWIASAEVVAKLKKYYKHVDDVDLFVGGILEKPLSGALLGPTFTCIVGDQFARARKGDRFIYDGKFSHSFTQGQLREIRKASFSRIICDNSDDLQTIQPFAFLMPQQS